MTLGEQLKLKGVDFVQGNIAKQNKNEQLFVAVENQNLQQIRLLLNSGADVNARDNYGYTPIMTAIENNDIKSCKLLVEYGAEINCKDNDGETPLIKAVLTESKIIVEFLIQKGACINETDELGETALMKASRSNLREIGNFLLMENAEYNLINCEGNTARDIAIKTWGKRKADFFLRLPLIEEDLLLQKSIYLLNIILSNKKIGFCINISEVKERFEKKYNASIDTDIIEKSLVSINEHFYELDFNVIINDEKIIISFCNENDTIKYPEEHICLEDSKNYDISSDFVSTIFLEKSQSLINEELVPEKSLSTNSKYNMQVDENVLKDFCISYVQNIKIGDKILNTKIIEIFQQKYNCNTSEALETEILKTVYSLIKAKFENTVTDIKVTGKELHLILLKQEFEKFCLSFVNEMKCGDRINLDEIEALFYQKYNYHTNELQEKIYSLIKTKAENTGLDIVKTENELQLIPLKQEIINFCLSFFDEIKCGDRINLDEIEDLFYQKYNCHIKNLPETIYSLAKSKYKDTQIDIKLTKREIIFLSRINLFLGSIFNKNNKNKFFSLSDIYNKFIARNEFSVSNEELMNSLYQSINKFELKDKNLILKVFFDLYIVLDKDNEIINVLNMYLPTKICRKKIQLSDEDICKINQYLIKKNLIFRPKKMDAEIFVLTKKDSSTNEKYIRNILSNYIKDLFFTEEKGFSKELPNLLVEIESLVDFSIREENICSILEIANQELSDKIIQYNKEKKILTLAERNIKNKIISGICPVCDMAFNENLEMLKKHILLVHTNTKYSIIDNRSGEYYCKHCNHEYLQLYSIPHHALFSHIFGDCMKKDFWIKTKPRYIEKINSTGKAIYSGTAYATTDANTLFENAGQMFRDNGRFGSYPVEDNHD